MITIDFNHISIDRKLYNLVYLWQSLLSLTLFGHRFLFFFFFEFFWTLIRSNEFIYCKHKTKYYLFIKKVTHFCLCALRFVVALWSMRHWKQSITHLKTENSVIVINGILDSLLRRPLIIHLLIPLLSAIVKFKFHFVCYK